MWGWRESVHTLQESPCEILAQFGQFSGSSGGELHADSPPCKLKLEGVWVGWVWEGFGVWEVEKLGDVGLGGCNRKAGWFGLLHP